MHPLLQSTLFNAIVENAKAASANYPFCTIEPNTGIVAVPDPRLEQLARVSKSKEIVRSHACTFFKLQMSWQAVH